MGRVFRGHNWLFPLRMAVLTWELRLYILKCMYTIVYNWREHYICKNGIGYNCCTFANLSWNKTTNWQKLTLAFASRIYSSQTLIFAWRHIWGKGQGAIVQLALEFCDWHFCINFCWRNVDTSIQKSLCEFCIFLQYM